MTEYSIKKIATIYNGFSEKFGIPRQSGLSSAESIIRFETPFRNADSLRGLEEYSHLWLVWWFSEFENQKWSPTVRPPRLGGNKRMGVFATRSPNRPNPIGLSVVEIVSIDYKDPEGPSLVVRGADLMNGTAILDIKPYLPYADAIGGASGGFAQEKVGYALDVEIPQEVAERLPEKTLAIFKQLLSQDPRPAYQHDPQRVYSMIYDNVTCRFRVEDRVLYVMDFIVESGDSSVSGTKTGI